VAGEVFSIRVTCHIGKEKLQEHSKRAQFEQTVLAHLDAAYNLARWLTRDDYDAEDVVQEACLRAFQYYDGFRGGDSRAWLLTIVRHTCYSWLQKNRAHELVSFDEELNDVESDTTPEEKMLAHIDQQTLRRALEELPVEFREVIILRELEELSYKEIARIASIPLGTVMSRLARARKQLQQRLTRSETREN
jgi:RNA polymerase sigma factor (sigma-70 family)